MTRSPAGDYGKRYEYGDNLIHVVAEQANEGIYTALIGRGKGEETESGEASAVASHSKMSSGA